MLGCPFGGVSSGTERRLDAMSKLEASQDGTVYGAYGSQDFYAHHAAAWSTSLVGGTMAQLLKGVTKLEAAIARRPAPVLRGA